MAASTTLTTKEVQAAAKDEVIVGGDTLVISKVYLWRNDQPRVTSPGEEVNVATHQKARTAHITLTIRRKGNQAGPESLTDSSLPYVVTLHVIRANDPDLVNTHPSESPEPDDPNSAHFAWPAPPASLDATEISEQDASDGGFFLAGSVDDGRGLTLSGWDGPRWGSLRNGIDDTVEFNAIVEFQGGIFLKSNVERLSIVH